jgi:hypothetical protein
MPDQLSKLRPDRDLQCYFQEPSAVAALSGTSEDGFTVSGCWRQQFDWVVVEWNRDNVFEHPALRNFPDGDLSGLHLSYEETRTNCIPLDSTTYDSIAWSYLRIWEESNNTENFHRVPLLQYAVAVDGSYAQPTVVFEYQGTPIAGDIVGLAWPGQYPNYWVVAGNSAADVASGLAANINAQTGTSKVSASANGSQVTLTYNGAPGANGNRVGVYGWVYSPNGGTGAWSPSWAMFQGGTSPSRWRVNLDFSNLNLKDEFGNAVTTTNVRKLRWTWAADLQFGNFARSEFAVAVTDWQVTGTNLQYRVAGPGSRRIEDIALPKSSYTGTWAEERGNYSGGSIHHTTTQGDHLQCTYSAAAHTLYLGTQYSDNGGKVTVQLDSNPALIVDLKRSLEDVLIRVPLGQFSGQAQHTVTVTHTGAAGTDVYFDFLEIAIPTADLPVFAAYPTTALATDWDTLHSQAIAPERTAWLINSLGFKGRANHYAGAMWFYELSCPGNQYASATIVFTGAPRFGDTTTVTLAGTPLVHVNLIGDTAQSIAKAFEFLITAGSSAVWAHSDGTTLTITARTMGSGGNGLTVATNTGNTNFTAQASPAALAGGAVGTWHTDLVATPRLNRAARDWSLSFFQALKSYGITVTTSFSMELGNGDDGLAAGIAQRYPDGAPAWLNTPALQTNFSPASTAFWQQVYLDMAGVMANAGVTPYLQFGEVQWWYFAAASGMPFYDDYTKSAFQTAHARPLGTITSQNATPATFPDECAFLPTLIGQFTQAIMDFVRQSHSDALFEVLYPPDTNDTPLNKLINLPTAYWTPAKLACFKTENFTYTGDRDLDKARQSIELPLQLGFSPSQSSHLVGIGEYTTPWPKEQRLALGEGLDSVVLFALDQFCLIGYGLPLDDGARRALFMGG